MTDDAVLRRAVLLARDAGDMAAAKARRIAMRNADPDDSDQPGRLFAASRWRPPWPAVTASQVRDAWTALDEFADAVAVVDRLLDERGASGRLGTPLVDTSTRLRDSNDAGALYACITDTLANLERVRVAIVLRRPITRPEDSTG